MKQIPEKNATLTVIIYDYPLIQFAILFVIAAIIVVKVVGLFTGKSGWTFAGFVVTSMFAVISVPFATCKNKLIHKAYKRNIK